MKPQRKTVRAGALASALNAHDEITKAKLANVLDAYHRQFLAPLELRVARLERPGWDRWLARLWGRP